MLNTYYVSVGGSDTGSGTLSQPFASLQHAHNLAQPGDTIYLRGGVYKVSSAIVLTKDGAAGAPITIQSYPGEKAVLDGSARSTGGYYAGWVVDMNSASHNVLKNIEIRNGAEGGLIMRGASHNNVLEGLDVHHNGRLSQWEGKGITVEGSSSNNLLLNNDSHHNQDQNLGNSDGFALGSTTGSGNVARGNRAWGNSDDGFDLFNANNGSVGGAWTLENNWAFNNGYASDGSAGTGDGNGFKLGGIRAGTSTVSGAHTLIGNVAVGNRVVGFDENAWNGGIGKLTLINNSAYDNGYYNYLFEQAGHVFKNNLSGGTGKTTVTGTQQANSWNLGLTVNGADFASLDKGLLDDARQANGSLPTSAYLHLVAGSDLIDRGVSTGLSYAGSAPDIGAFEMGITNKLSPGSSSDRSMPSQLSVQHQRRYDASLDVTLLIACTFFAGLVFFCGARSRRMKHRRPRT